MVGKSLLHNSNNYPTFASSNKPKHINTMTLITELKEIANVCNTSQEFAERAKAYIKRKGINQTIMSDGELREMYRAEESQKQRKKAWDCYNQVIYPQLHQRADCKGLYYECWCDISDCWEDMYLSVLCHLSIKDILEFCAKWLNERERFYNSPDYIDSLNASLSALKWEE